MAIATLSFVGPSTSFQSIELKYVIDGSTDEVDAVTSLLATAPPMLGVYVRGDYHLEPLDASDQLWEGTVTYVFYTNNNPDGQNDPTYSFDLGVEKTKVTTSLQTIQSYPIFPVQEDYQGSINVQDDGTVEGVDVNFPVFSWTETHYLPYSFMNRKYFVLLFNLCATMNLNSFRGFDKGEVLFLGVSGSKRFTAQDWECQFKFLASPTGNNLKVGPITVVQKLGHDYLWAKYQASVDTTANALVRIPRAVYVERVYTMNDLNQLNLVNPLAL